MSNELREILIEARRRTRVPVHIRYKEDGEKSNVVDRRKEVDYKYYKCDFCGDEIRIKPKQYEMLGGKWEIPMTLSPFSAYPRVQLCLCNKCVKPVVIELEKMVEEGKINAF